MNMLLMFISYLCFQVWEEMHTTGSPKPVGAGASTFLPTCLPFLPSNEVIEVRGKSSQGTGLHMEFCSSVSPLGLCFGENGTLLSYILHLIFQYDLKVHDAHWK